MDFCTLAMFIIDDIYFPVPRAPVTGILGGAGSYAALGARLFRKPPRSRKISWTVHVGSDFPDNLRQEIDSWETSCNLISTPERLTTQSLNIYGKNEYRGFEYKTPKKRVDHTMLTAEQILAKCFHLICTPARCLVLVKGLLEKRSMTGLSEARGSGTGPTSSASWTKRPLFVWEPVPDSCKPEEFTHMLEALKVVDVLSPNHHELASFFGSSNTVYSSEASELVTLRHQCTELLEHGFQKGQGAVIVRRGEKGCYVASSHRQLAFPAYHQPKPENPAEARNLWRQRVIDPTGGGNAFLGGFCVGLLDASAQDAYGPEYAALYGSVAASFAIEQVGMPELSHSDDGQELWNGEVPEDRLKEFQIRVLSANTVVVHEER